jgi:hypothetical protein
LSTSLSTRRIITTTYFSRIEVVREMLSINDKCRRFRANSNDPASTPLNSALFGGQKEVVKLWFVTIIKRTKILKISTTFAPCLSLE